MQWYIQQQLELWAWSDMCLNIIILMRQNTGYLLKLWTQNVSLIFIQYIPLPLSLCFCSLFRLIWSLLCMYHKTKPNTAQWARPIKRISLLIRTSIEINRNYKYHEQKRVTTRNMTSRLKRRMRRRSKEKIFAYILFPAFMCNQQHCVSTSLHSCPINEIQFNWSIYFRQLNSYSFCIVISISCDRNSPLCYRLTEAFGWYVCFIHFLLQICSYNVTNPIFNHEHNIPIYVPYCFYAQCSHLILLLCNRNRPSTVTGLACMLVVQS